MPPGKDLTAVKYQPMEYPNLHINRNPLAQHFLTQLRDRTTQPADFRLLSKKLTVLLALDASLNLACHTKTIMTPLEEFDGVQLAPIVAVAILRAGLGMIDSVLELFPDVSVGYIGLARDETTAIASSYYAKLPPNIEGKPVFLLDPMLATGGSAAQACDAIKKHNVGQITMVSVVCAPEGVGLMLERHPDVPIFTAALDRELNSQKYIIPGLGDFGDRLYGT